MSLLNKIKKDLQRLKKNFRTRDIDNFIRDLEVFINQPSEEEIQKALKVFLNERWQDIAGGPLSYTCRPHHPVTKLSRAIAEYLQPSFPDECVYQILMPSIKKTYNVLSLEYDLDDYGLDELILSEDRTHLIPANLIFSFSFEMVGLHELTSVYVEHEDELPAPLTSEEQKAIIHHNDTSRRLYQKFEELKKIPTETNLGTELKNLGLRLLEGGTPGEYATRHETYQQVRDFFCLFNALSESDRNALSQLRIRSDDSYTLGEILRAMNGEMVGTTCVVTNGNNILRCIEYNAQFFNRYFEISNAIKARYNEYLLPIATQRLSGQDTAKNYCPYIAKTHIQEYGYLNWLSALRMMLVSGMAEHEILEEIEYLLQLERSQSFLREYIDPEALVNLMLENGYVQLLHCCLNINSLAFSEFRKIDLFPKLNQAFIQALKDKEVRSIRLFLEYFKDELFSKPTSKLIRAIIKTRRFDLLETALDRGLRPQQRLPGGICAFDVAIQEGSLAAFKRMMGPRRTIEKDCKKNSAVYTRYLHALVKTKDTQFIHWFLDNIPFFQFDLKVNRKKIIHLAVDELDEADLDVVRHLVEKANTQVALSETKQSLETLTIKSSWEDSWDDYGLGAALCYFAKHQETNLALECLKPNTLMLYVDRKGYTALHYAIEHDNEALQDAILEHNAANPHINSNHVTPERPQLLTRILGGIRGNDKRNIGIGALGSAPRGTMSAAHFAMERRNYPAFKRIMAYHEQGTGYSRIY